MDIFDSCLNQPESTHCPTPRMNKPVDDDVFGSSVSLEKAHIEEGYADGYKDGLVLGRQDGYEVGLKVGFETGEEIGFYRGLVNVWTSAVRVDPNCFSTRVRKNIEQMRELLNKYPLMDPEDESKDDIMEGLRLKFRAICATLGMEGLRLKFRAICATLGVKLEYNGYPKRSDAEEF